MKWIIWKLRYAWYMSRLMECGFWWSYGLAETAKESDPDNIYIDGPRYYVEEEIANWYE